MGYTVYALVDAREPEAIRYIGFTKDPASRLRYHVFEARRSQARSHRLHWLRSLDRDASEAVMRPLVILQTDEEAARVEVALIASYRARGCALVNGTDGGEGVSGFGGVVVDRRPLTDEQRARKEVVMSSAETRAKMRAAALDRMARDPDHLVRMRARHGPITIDQRQKISASLAGRPKSPEHAAKVGAAHRGRPKSAEQRAKISATKTGNSPVSAEMRAQISAKMKGVPKSPETRARMKEAQRLRFARGPA